MPDKHNNAARSTSHKPGSGHGSFKHRAKPANLRAVLDAYGLKRADYERVRNLVSKDLEKTAAHGR